VPATWRAAVVELVRRSRDHPDVRVGSSVRGSIDIARLAVSLSSLRGTAATDWQVGLDAALVALTGRVRLHESCARSPEEVVRELYEGVFGVEPAADADSAETAEDGGAPGGA